MTEVAFEFRPGHHLACAYPREFKGRFAAVILWAPEALVCEALSPPASENDCREAGKPQHDQNVDADFQEVDHIEVFCS